MAVPLGDTGPPYSLHSISSVDSELDDMDLLSDGDDQERQNQEVFVLRERKGVIYPLDYKYRVGEFDKIYHTVLNVCPDSYSEHCSAECPLGISFIK